MAAIYDRPEPATGDLVKLGVISGIIAGIVFAMAEMLISLAMGNPLLSPLRLISSIVLGEAALQPNYSIVMAILVGVTVLVITSVICGVIFVYALKTANQLSASDGKIILYGTIFGCLLWLINFMFISPTLFPQFQQTSPLWAGFIAHTFAFGTVLGAVVANQRE